MRDGPPPAPSRMPTTFGRPSRLVGNVTVNPMSVSLSAMKSAAPSSRAGASSGSSGFSASGWPAGTSSQVRSSHAFSVMRSSTRRSSPVRSACSRTSIVGSIVVSGLRRRLLRKPRAKHGALLRDLDEVQRITDYSEACRRLRANVRKFPSLLFWRFAGQRRARADQDGALPLLVRRGGRRPPTADRCDG